MCSTQTRECEHALNLYRIPHMPDRHIVHFQDMYVHMKYTNILSLSLLTIHICHFVTHELALYV